MQISIILAHPNPDSFNNAIAYNATIALIQNDHNVIIHDLYEEGFEPNLPFDEIPSDAELPEIIKQHCKEIADADGIIIVHPNWWGMPPALLKGWIDRVIRPGVAYRFIEGDNGEGVLEGLLKAKAALVFNTSNTVTEREISVFQDPLETIWKNCIFGLCGVETFHRRMFNVVVTSTKEQRTGWLKEVRDTVDKYFPKDRK